MYDNREGQGTVYVPVGEKVDTISGVIKSIRYANEKNGYTVCDLKTEHSVITLVGVMPLLVVGENVEATGDFVQHVEYGRQFQVASCQRKTPTKEEEMKEYLSGGFIKGLGPATAQKIVETFGEKTFEIFKTEPYRLSEVKGITPEKALMFGQAFVEHENMRGIVMLMQHYGVSASYATKIWKVFGTQAEAEIKRNPYRLIDSDIGLSFQVCDRIAFSLGLEPFSKERLKSALIFLLNTSSLNGHSYTPKEELLKKGMKLTRAPQELLLDALDALMLEGRVYAERQHPDRIYTEALIEAERYCARRLWAINQNREEPWFRECDELLADYEARFKICMDTIQKNAVKCALSQGVSVITGGPGTGKTTIIKSLIHIFETKGYSVILAAPTGRAAKRISETSGCEAKTIHRLLEVGYSIENNDKPYFMRNEDNPLTSDVLIIDEASMIDIILFHALLKAFPPHGRLILVGDADQLPSVGPGKVLADIIDSGCFPVVKLETIFRQTGQSLIITNAHLINQGRIPAINQEEGDFFFIQKLSSMDVAKSVVDLCYSYIPERFGLDPFKDIQVLSPMRKGDVGTSHLNVLLQERLNPYKEGTPQKEAGGVVFRLGDRVMQIKNDYTLPWVLPDEKGGWTEGLGVYNGDLGLIIDIDLKSELITVRFDDQRTCEYRFDQLDNLEHAYAITVHKSQGSEFPAVVIPLYGVPKALTCRNLLYTAVTRAKKLVVLVGSPTTMEEMIRNINEKERFSGLKERLSEAGSQA